MKKDKRINNDLQNITQKTEDQKNTNLTRNGGKGGGGAGSEFRCSGRGSSSCSTFGTRRVTLIVKPVDKS